jgi:steroid delta-isomerase
MQAFNVRPAPTEHPAAPIRRLAQLFAALSPEDLVRLPEVYAEHAEFSDPFNHVHGVAAIEILFRHMFERLENPRFEVLHALGDQHEAMLTWDFRFRFRSAWLQPAGSLDQCIHGATFVAFAADGRVQIHRDYWDAADQFYAKVPGLGWLMRALKRAAAADIPAALGSGAPRHGADDSAKRAQTR